MMSAKHDPEIHQFILVPVLWLLLFLFLIALRFMVLHSLIPLDSFLSLNYHLNSSSGVLTPPLPLLSCQIFFFPCPGSVSLKSLFKKRKDARYSTLASQSSSDVCLCGTESLCIFRESKYQTPSQMLRYLFSCVYLIYYQVFSEALHKSEVAAVLALWRFVFLIKLSSCVDETHNVGSSARL